MQRAKPMTCRFCLLTGILLTITLSGCGTGKDAAEGPEAKTATAPRSQNEISQSEDRVSVVPSEELSRFLDIIKSQDFHRMRREGEKVFQTNLYIPDHEAKFKGFAVSEPQPGHLHYSLFSVKGTGGAAEIAVVLDKKTGRIILFSAIDVSF
jgi:hypothetical protein